MIRKASIAISKWLLNTGAISEDDKELYEYAAYSFLFSLLPLCLVIIIGCAVNMVIEGILMVIPFMLIRKFSGGFHLNSSAVCFVSSTALLSLFIFIVKFVTISAQIPLFTGGVVLAQYRFSYAARLIMKPGSSAKRKRSRSGQWQE